MADTIAEIAVKKVEKPVPAPTKPAPVIAIAAPPKVEKKIIPPPPAKPLPVNKPVVVVAQPKPVPPVKAVAVAVQPKPNPVPPVAVVAPSVIYGAAELEKRVTKSDQSLFFESDSLVLTLYDNGEVDGDTVTVLMNGNVIFSKAGLTTKANSKTIHITPDLDSVNLVMYAESLGEIPPNTGLMIVNDGAKRYDVRFSADLKTNAGIILRRRKKE